MGASFTIVTTIIQKEGAAYMHMHWHRWDTCLMFAL